MTCKHILLITFLNEFWLILLHTVKWFQVFRTQIILFNINHLKRSQVLLFNTNNSIKHQSFVCTQFNDQTVLFQTIQFSTSLNAKQFHFTHR